VKRLLGGLVIGMMVFGVAHVSSAQQGKGPFLVACSKKGGEGFSQYFSFYIGLHPTSVVLARRVAASLLNGAGGISNNCSEGGGKEAVVCDKGGWFAVASWASPSNGNVAAGLSCGAPSREAAERQAVQWCQKEQPGGVCEPDFSAFNDGIYHHNSAWPIFPEDTLIVNESTSDSILTRLWPSYASQVKRYTCNMQCR
jgi:hypothetical protein